MSTTNPFISPSPSSSRRGGALSSLSLNQVVVKTEDICGNEKSTLTTKISSSSSDNPADVIALDSDSLILGLGDDEGGDANMPTTSSNVTAETASETSNYLPKASPAQSMEPEMARSVPCAAAVPPPPAAAVTPSTPTKQSFQHLSKSTPARTRTPSTATFPSCTKYVPRSASSRSPPPPVSSFHRRVTPIPSSPSTSQSRTAQWEARRAEELRRRAEEEKSMLDMLTSIDRGNEEQKLARKSINNVCSKPATASSASPLSNKDNHGHAELGDDSSMSFIHQPPTTPHGSVVSGGTSSSFQSYGSPVPSKPTARGTLSPQEHTDTEKSCNNKTAADSEEEEDDSKTNNNAASPVNDDSIPDPCEATISGRTETSLEDVNTHEATKASPSPSSIVSDKKEEAKVEPTSRVTPVSFSRSPQRAAAVVEASSLSPSSSQHRGGLLISPQRPSRTLTSAELRVAEAVSSSLARAQSQPRLSGTKGCSVTVSPFSSKTVSPVPLPQIPVSSSSFVTAHPTANNTISGSPLKVSNSTNTGLLPSIPSTPAVVMTSTVSSGTPLLLVSTATQMTPQLAVVVTTPGRAEVEEATPPPTPEATPPPPCTAEKEEQNELHSVAQEREEMEKSAVNEQSDAEAGEQESVAQAESQSDEESCTNNEEEVDENDDEVDNTKNNEDNKKEDSHVEESATVAPETEEEEEPQKEILQMPIGRKRSRDTGSSPSLKASEDLYIECLDEHKAVQERESLERSEAAAAVAATAKVAPVLVVAVKSECDDENITPATTTTTLVATRKKILSAKLIKKALAAKEANKKKNSSDVKIHVAAADTTPLHIPKANLKHKLAQEHRERMREERDQKQPKKTNAASGGKKKKKK